MSTEEKQRDGAEDKALRDLDKAEADLRRAEEEVREAEEELEESRHREVTIVVDGADHQVRRGSWIVSELKAAVGVDPAKVLAQISAQGLKDLPDEETIEVHQGERFMSHARSGASS